MARALTTLRAGVQRVARRSPDVIRGLSVVAERRRLLRGEIAGLPVPLPYRLRGSGLTAYVRHGRSDLRRLARTIADTQAPPTQVSRLLNDRPVRLLDAGAGLGYFALGLLSLFPNAEILSVEPDPIRAVLLRRCVRANELGGRWSVIEAVAAASDGARRLEVDAIGTPPIGDQRSSVLTVAACDVLPALRSASIVRLGPHAERGQILADPRFTTARVPVVVIDTAPELALLATPSLRDAGYLTARCSGSSLWAWLDA